MIRSCKTPPGRKPNPMTTVIRQSVELAASPEDLFDTYLDRRRHAAVTDGKVSISPRVGRSFSAFDGMITGRNLHILPKRLIVQSWRSAGWRDGDADSILVLSFGLGKRKGMGRIDLIHIGVPDHDRDGVTKGWPQSYWRPWRKYLRAR